MKPAQDVYAAIQQRLLHECERVRAGRQEMEGLAAAYNRYRDLKTEVDEHWKRINYILRLVGPERAAKIKALDRAGILSEVKHNPEQSDELRRELSIWRAIREYLRESGDARVGEIQAFLAWIGFRSVSRQAIESALKRHERTFRVRTSSHERFVSLK